MFTGIVEEIGTILELRKKGTSADIVIQAKEILKDIRMGDSIAVNGICLTVTSFCENRFTADIMHETMVRSSIGSGVRGSHVNLERALQVGGRLGGHIVTGHIDGTGKIRNITQDGNAISYRIGIKPYLAAGIVEKGSIAIDGISLTVVAVTEEEVTVSVIPHTTHHTILSEKQIGDIVNIETDCIGKYVARLMQICEKPEVYRKTEQENDKKLTVSFLYENGFMN